MKCNSCGSTTYNGVDPCYSCGKGGEIREPDISERRGDQLAARHARPRLGAYPRRAK